MKDLPVMGKGDLLQIDWVDIFENSVGDPRTAKLARRTSFGLLWEVGEDDGVPVIVTTTTIDKDPGQEGFCIYPTSCVTEVQVVKKARKPRKASRSSSPSLECQPSPLTNHPKKPQDDHKHPRSSDCE